MGGPNPSAKKQERLPATGRTLDRAFSLFFGRNREICRVAQDIELVMPHQAVDKKVFSLRIPCTNNREMIFVNRDR